VSGEEELAVTIGLTNGASHGRFYSRWPIAKVELSLEKRRAT
jgi:hypothetical protein